MVADINAWKIGGCTLVLWKSRRVERLKENSMWSWLRRKFQIWFWQIVISACRIIMMGGHGKEQLLKTSGRRSSLKDKQEERIYATLLTLSQLSRGLYLHPWPIWLAGWESWDHKWSLMTDNLDPTPVGLPTTMSTSTLTVIMPPNTSCQLNREGHWWPVQQVSWAGRHGFTISILWQSFKDRMMEWWS